MKELKKLVEETIADACFEGLQFFSSDVTDEVRCSNPSASHNDVASIVREVFESGGMNGFDYIRTLVVATIEETKEKHLAYLYHHKDVNLNKVDMSVSIRPQENVVPQQTSENTNDVIVYTNKPEVLESVKRSLTEDGRLSIPAHWLKQICNRAGCIFKIDNGFAIVDESQKDRIPGAFATFVVGQKGWKIPKSLIPQSKYNFVINKTEDRIIVNY
jgi:hypothetical protein